jgi:diguanylate cyclase (GGDEF)-like protein
VVDKRRRALQPGGTGTDTSEVQSERQQRRGPGLSLSPLFDRLFALPRHWLLAVGLVLTLAIAVLDYVTGPRILLNIFYLLPVMLVAWGTQSSGYGLIVAATSCLVTPVEAVISGFRLDPLPVALWNGSVRLAVFCIVLYLMESVRTLMAQLQGQALSDELTGLANRRAFGEIAAREVERSRRFDHQVSLAYIDIDDFKGTNDRLGHEAGDRLLIALASLALATARSVDTVARIGGDEFVILMPETGADAALPLVTRLRDAFPRAAKAGEASATCSIGLASFAHAPDSVEGLLAAADALMYEAKAAGRNKVRHALVQAGSSGSAQGRLLPFSPGSRA